MAKQFIIIIEGPMGSGKSTIGKLVHAQLPRTAELGLDKIKWSLSDYERGPRDNEIIGKVLQAMARTFLEQECSILLPSGFWKKEYVQPYLDLAEEFKTDLYFYQLTAPEDILRERVNNRKADPKKPAMTQERIDKNLRSWSENRYGIGKEIDTTKYSAEEASAMILKDIQNSLSS